MRNQSKVLTYTREHNFTKEDNVLQKCYLDFGFSSVTSLKVTDVSVGIVLCVILYFCFFLFVIRQPLDWINAL